MTSRQPVMFGLAPDIFLQKIARRPRFFKSAFFIFIELFSIIYYNSLIGVKYAKNRSKRKIVF